MIAALSALCNKMVLTQLPQRISDRCPADSQRVHQLSLLDLAARRTITQGNDVFTQQLIHQVCLTNERLMFPLLCDALLIVEVFLHLKPSPQSAQSHTRIQCSEPFLYISLYRKQEMITRFFSALLPGAHGRKRSSYPESCMVPRHGNKNPACNTVKAKSKRSREYMSAA